MLCSPALLSWELLRLLTLDILQLDLGVTQLLAKLFGRCFGHRRPRQLQVTQ